MPRNTNADLIAPTTTLVPGFLVNLRTSVTGNVSLHKEVIDAPQIDDQGHQRSKWVTERLVEDPEEHTKANQTRMRARQIISAVCSKSSFGLLCAEADIAAYRTAVAEAKSVVAAFNRRARMTRVEVFVIAGQIARDDVDAARAINSEVQELLTAMSAGVKNCNAKAVRDATARLRGLGSMLQPEVAAQVKGVLGVARKAARKIVKAGEAAAQQIDRESIREITRVRGVFVEMDQTGAAAGATVRRRAPSVDAEVESAPEEPVAENVQLDIERDTELRSAMIQHGVRTGRLPAKNPAKSNLPKKGRAKSAA